MPRTTAIDVADIVEVDSDIDLTVFILMANELVTEVCSDSEYSDVRLELIERWLAAHFYVIRDPRASSESAGVSQSYALPSVAMSFQGTKEGQQALLLDTDGNLAALGARTTSGGKKSSIGVTWLGTEAD